MDDFNHRLDDLQGQLDRRIETQLREAKLQHEALEAMIEALDKRVGVMFDGTTQAIEIAEQEREKAAQQLRDAMRTAEQEREKSAEQLRQAMETSIRDGDSNLARHIGEQIAAIRTALTAAEKLGDEKDKRLEAIREAAQLAVDKALIAQKELAEKHNDLIRSSERKEATYVTKGELEQVKQLVQQSVPREVLETKLEAIDKELAGIDKARHLSDGGTAEREQRQAQVQPWMIWAAGAVLAVFMTGIVLVANLVTA